MHDDIGVFGFGLGTFLHGGGGGGGVAGRAAERHYRFCVCVCVCVCVCGTYGSEYVCLFYSIVSLYFTIGGIKQNYFFVN